MKKYSAAVTRVKACKLGFARSAMAHNKLAAPTVTFVGAHHEPSKREDTFFKEQLQKLANGPRFSPSHGMLARGRFAGLGVQVLDPVLYAMAARCRAAARSAALPRMQLALKRAREEDEATLLAIAPWWARGWYGTSVLGN